MPLPPRPPRPNRSAAPSAASPAARPAPIPPTPDPRRRGTLADALAYADDVYRVARLAIEVTVRALERTTGRRYAHQRAWDHASRPGRHLLESPFGCLDRAWVSYLPLHDATRNRASSTSSPPRSPGTPDSPGTLAAPAALGILFHLHLLDAAGRIEPALMVGRLDPGPRGFAAVHPRAVVRCIRRAEAGRPGYDVRRRGPLAVVTSGAPGELAEVVLFRVPLDHLAGYRHLLHAVIHPLMALLAGDVELAEALLEHVGTLDWPPGGTREGDGARAA